MTEWVAEIGSNYHHKTGGPTLSRAKLLIRTAAEIGCDAVKFQFIPDDGIYAPAALGHYTLTVPMPPEWLPELRQEAHDHGLTFGCSVFTAASVGAVIDYVDFLKVSSYSVLDSTLLDIAQATRRPVVIGTGMASVAELETVMARPWRDRVTLLHCVSSYPVLPQDCHLANIGLLRRTFGCNVGWSDHSASPSVVGRAAGRWRATMVECHLDLDGQGLEFSHGHCWTPDRLRATIRDIRSAEGADGLPGKPVAVETTERLWRADPSDGLRPTKELRDRWTALRIMSS